MPNQKIDWSKIPQGTPVRCIDDDERERVTVKVKKGSRYEFRSYYGDFIEVEEIIGYWYADRFVPIIDYGEPEDE